MDKYQDTKEFPCPNCSELSPIPDQGATGLRVNFFAKSVLDAGGDHSTSSKDTLINGICLQPGEHVPVVSNCVECSREMCNVCGCTCNHNSFNFTKPQKRLLTCTESQNAKKLNPSQRILYCKIHSKEQLKYFCKKDHCLICQTCVELKHEGHPLVDIEHTSKANLRSAIDLGRQQSAKYESCIKEAHVVKNDIEEKKTITRVKLAAERKKEHDKVDAKFDKKETEARAVASASLKDTEACLAKLKLEKETVDGSIKQLEILRDHGHPSDIVCMLPEIHNKRIAWSIPPDSKLTTDYNHKDDHVKREKRMLFEDFLDIAILQNDDIVKIGDGYATIYDGDFNRKESITFPVITGVSYKTKEDAYVIMSPSRFDFYNMNNGALLKSVYNPIQNATDFVIDQHSEIVILAHDSKIIRLSETGRILNLCDLDGTSGREKRKGVATMQVNSKNDIIMSYNGGIAGIRLVKDAFRKFFEYIPNRNAGSNMYAHVDNNDNIITVNKAKNTVELLTPNGVYMKDLIPPNAIKYEVIQVESNSKGELFVGVMHKGSSNMCMFKLRYRRQDGTIA
ncbi:unnamed protein product [Owenia fusiformis]|uniref:B box-type domain-containing protein n=1 Tax=Owenia fusiformis TaxID=6347 RepID=A0A8S4Q9R1_OWEFU|nr:unnamed protein product [Owenia fusiformis]